MKYELCIIKNDKVIGNKKFRTKKAGVRWIAKNILVCSKRGMSFSLHKI